MPWNNHTPTCLLAALLMASCAAVSPVSPDPVWLADCPVPSGPVATNGALAARDQARGLALRACNTDKAALRAWAEQLKRD